MGINTYFDLERGARVDRSQKTVDVFNEDIDRDIDLTNWTISRYPYKEIELKKKLKKLKKMRKCTHAVEIDDDPGYFMYFYERCIHCRYMRQV